MFKLKHTLIAFTTAIVAVSCSTSEQAVVTPYNNAVVQVSDANARLAATDDLRENVARKLAKALGSAQIRAYLKSEVLKKYDGDYDLLFSKAIDYIVKNHPNSELASLASSTSQASLLNISVPVKAEEWNTQTVIPLVAFLPEDFDEKTATEIKAFDAAGNVHLLSAKTEPNTPVVVISNSERAKIEQGKVVLKSDIQSAKNSKSARVGNTGERMYGFTFGDFLGDYESWANGTPEVRLTISGARDGAIVNPIYVGYWEPKYRSEVTGQNWVIFDTFTYTWTLDYGQYATYTWVEEDGGATESIPISISWAPVTGGGNVTQLSTTVPKGNRDEEMGSVSVWRGDSNPRGYGSKFRFSVRYIEP